MPHLREIGLSFSHGLSRDPAHYAWLWDTEAGRRIERLSLNEGSYALAAWREALEAHPTAMRRLVLFGRNDFELTRTPRGWTQLSVAAHPALYPIEREQLDATLAAFREGGVEIVANSPRSGSAPTTR